MHGSLEDPISPGSVVDWWFINEAVKDKYLSFVKVRRSCCKSTADDTMKDVSDDKTFLGLWSDS